MTGAVSHSSTHGALRVLEQGSLLSGADLMPLLNGNGRKKRARKKEAAPKPGFAAALALVVQRGRQVAKEIGKTALSRCPRCGHVGPTEQDFGTRIMAGGKRRPQSWCRDCRKVNLPPLKALPNAAGRREKATHSDTAQEKPAAKARVSSSAPRSDGWLFPPDALGGKRRDS
jgi:hypothetical protein